ncbi:MAG: tail fiber domain-containing protein, partial [Bdellovibrionaceae bacterium]|nr:tail fiber domain-containing protein [Pseudobdellovibrionaceae bacterium]
LQFTTAGSQKMVIQSGGNVGIGTTSPSFQLTNSVQSNVTDSTPIGLAGAKTFVWETMAAETNTGYTAAILNSRNAATSNGLLLKTTDVSSSTRILTANSNGTDRFIVRADGNVGIGTTAPKEALDIRSGHIFHTGGDLLHQFNGYYDGAFRYAGYGGGSKYTGHIRFVPATGNISFETSTAAGVVDASAVMQTNLSILSSGNVGIGTTGPADKLHVAGDIRVGTGTTGCVKDADGTVIAGTCSSDARFKTDIEPLGSRLEQVSQLRPVTYKWRSEEFPDKHFGHETETGLIAQEVQQAVPELVAEDEEGYLKVRFTELNIYILQAVKDLYNRILGIEDHQATQDRRIANVEAAKANKAEIETLKAENAKLKADAAKQKQESDAKIKALEERFERLEKSLKSK